jgi:DNA-binding transcriptional LysR family regulator
MADRFTAMQVFVRTAALGSLSAAARALGMSQTMAAKHVGALEARLGVKLLYRTTRRVTLTDAGRIYLDAAERILGEVDAAEAEAAAGAVEVSGTLRLNVPVSFGIREIAPIIPDFLKDHPALTIDLGLTDRRIDLIEEGWDAAVRIGDMTDLNLSARWLAPCHTVVCAAPAYLKKHGTPQTVADLARHNCLGYTLSQTHGANRWLFGEDRKATAAIGGSIISNNGDALAAAAIAGQGIVYPPTFLVHREIAAGLLVLIQLDAAPIVLQGVFAVYPAGRRPAAKVRALIDFLVKRFGPAPPWERQLAA